MATINPGVTGRGPKAKREEITYAQPNETSRYLTIPKLIERWDCSGMTVERLIRNDPDFPPILRIGLGRRARMVSYEAVVEYEKSKIASKSRAA